MLVLPIFLIAFLLQLFMPWWITGIIAFAISAWQARTGKHAFRGGFIAIALLWLVMSLWKSLPNDNILANRVGQMFMLPNWPFTWIIVAIITALIGGLAAGFAALSGFLVRRTFVKSETEKES